MTNLAILCCLDANDVCTGAGCLRALRERRGGFACYEGQETELLAFLRCSHCSTPLEEDAGMQEKLERLVSIGTQAVHIGVCAQPKGEKCPYMAANAKWLEDHGIQVIWKTFKSFYQKRRNAKISAKTARLMKCSSAGRLCLL